MIVSCLPSPSHDTLHGVNELWNQLASRANLTLSPEQHQKLSTYIDLLLQANLRMNLTRIDDRASAEVSHVGDALTLLPFLPAGPIQLADVGSGGGVPGLPLAIARPDAKVFLIESTQKKAVFLRSTAKTLGLSNVHVIGERAESAGRGTLRDACDIVTARAVGTLDFLVEWCLPLVKNHGKFLAMKGAKIAEELPEAEKAIKMLNGGQAIIHPVALPGTEHHVIVEIPKLGRSPIQYPRDPTFAKGKPIR